METPKTTGAVHVTTLVFNADAKSAVELARLPCAVVRVARALITASCPSEAQPDPVSMASRTSCSAWTDVPISEMTLVAKA